MEELEDLNHRVVERLKYLHTLNGIDKLTYRHGLALQDRGLNAQYIDASAHCEVIFKSKHARKSHIPVTVIVNLSIPEYGIDLSKTGLHRSTLDLLHAAIMGLRRRRPH